MNPRRRVLMCAVAASTAALALPAVARQDHDKGQGKGAAKSGALPPPSGLDAVQIRALLGAEVGVLAVGAKPLPPGMRKRLERGKPLPPGIAKQRAPAPLIARLPRYDGWEWVRIGTELILVGIATAVIREIIEGVFG
jgi:hypothetical protein